MQACFVKKRWVDRLFSTVSRRTFRTINIQKTAPEIAHRLRWCPEAIVKLMGSKSFFMLDLENPGEIDRVLEVLEFNPRRQFRNFNSWLNCWIDMTEEGGDNVITTAQNIFRDAWLSRAYTMEDISDSDDSSDEESNEHPSNQSSDASLAKLQKRLKGMPEIRLVYTFEKDKDTEVSPWSKRSLVTHVTISTNRAFRMGQIHYKNE